MSIAGSSIAEENKISTHKNNSHPISYEGKSTKFALLVGDVTHFKSAILTAGQMKEANQKFTIEIIIVGELAKAISEDGTLIEDINKAEKLQVQLWVCEVAMALFKVSRSKLDKRILTVRNGWIHMFEVKDKGYNTLNS